MSPRKQPSSLFNNCVKSCISLINSACYVLDKNYPESNYNERESQAFALKCHLMSLLPARLFDVLCSERTLCQYRGDPRLQLNVLAHPYMTVFRKCDLDNAIPQTYWIEMLPKFSRLVILDLKFICTDEILHVIGSNCLLLEEINIVSRVDICKSLFNASVLIRNVSDAGLCSIANLKQLRVLAMDPPRNERANRVGRCVSQSGIIRLISELPYLEELRIESCDIGSTLIGSERKIGPLSLKKINCHFASAKGIQKLFKICPYLRELSVTHLSEHDKDEILDQMSRSEVRLHRLDLSFFSYTEPLHQLLLVKGCFLTHFSLWEIDHLLTLDALLTIGQCCPNLNTLCLITQSRLLEVPRYFLLQDKVFPKLTNLTIGNDKFDIIPIVTFFLNCTQNIRQLVLKYQSKVNLDVLFTNLLRKGFLKNLRHLWLDISLEISKDVALRIIEACENLQTFTKYHFVAEDLCELQRHICENNLDLKLGIY